MTSEFKNRQMQTNRPRPSKKLETKTRKLEKKTRKCTKQLLQKTGKTGIIEYY